jgi:hypothetical protein
MDGMYGGFAGAKTGYCHMTISPIVKTRFASVRGHGIQGHMAVLQGGLRIIATE